MPPAVLDSYALLALFRKERGDHIVRKLLDTAAETGELLHMTEVNYMEVKYILVRKHGAAAWQRESAFVDALPIQFHPLTRELADIAADYKAKHALSLADACTAALANNLRCPVVTGDPVFRALEGHLQVQWL